MPAPPLSGSRPAPPAPRHLGLAAVALILLLGVIALPVRALAGDVRADDEIAIASTDQVTGDLYVAAGRFTLDGRASRDVNVAAGEIDISGRIDGSLNATGGDITVSGPVAGSVRLLGGNTVLAGPVGGDLLIFGGRTVIDETAVINGDVHAYGGVLDVHGTVQGDVNGSVGQLDLAGTVDGDIDIEVESLDVGATANVGGSLEYTSQDEADIATAAGIAGPVEHDMISPWGSGDSFRSRFFGPLVRTLSLLIAGAVIVVLAPRFAAAASANVRHPWVAAIVGVLSLMLVPMIAILLMVTIVGIPIGIILLALYGIALYLSQITVGQRIGTLLLPRHWNDGSRGFLLLAMTIGVILISALRFVPVPWLGAVVNLLVAIVGLGAAVLLMRQLRPRHVSRA